MIREGSYLELSRKIHDKVTGERSPLEATIEVSRRCPLNCAHCYNNLPMNDLDARSKELSHEEICGIIDEMVEAGTMWLLFTGGEIFARHDFLDIYRYAHSKGFFITLFTNAILVDERIVDVLAEHRPFSVEVTLYGYTKQTYEALTRIPGSYEKCLRGIRLLRDRGLPLKLKTVAVSINKHEIREMKTFAEEELGVSFKFDGMINPRIDCSQSPLEVRLTPRELVRLDLEDEERVTEYRDFALRYAEIDANREKTVYSCGGGLGSFAVDPYGRMSICILSEVDKYDLRQGSIEEGWGSFLKDVRERPITRPTKCTECTLKSFCGMCPANGELENGDPEEPVEFLCEVAHLRAATFGVPVSPHGECEHCKDGEYRDHVAQTAEELKQDVLSGIPIRRKPVATNEALQPACGGGCSSCTVPDMR